MKRDREQAKSYYLRIIHESWTYNKLTDAEKQTINIIIIGSEVFGTFEQRVEIMMQIYNAFLHGLGYDGVKWRATEEERTTMPNF